MLSNIDSKKIAYLIGFLAGDGAFCDGFGKRSHRMAITTTDMDVVNWISKNIEYFSIDNPKFTNNIESGIFAQQASYTKTFAVKYSEFFNKYGILCKKTERSYNNISKADMKHFMLGLIDSDGCISFTRRKDRDRISGKVSITHQSVMLLSKLQTFLAENLGIASTIKPKGTEKCFVFGFSKIEHIEKFCEWLYSDINDVVLKRKFDKWMELKNGLSSLRETGACYPKEFMACPEYWSIVGSISKYMFIVDGVEYPSASIAGKIHNVDNATVQRRCRQGDMGYSRRPKTDDEKREYSTYVDKMIKKLFVKWSENQ